MTRYGHSMSLGDSETVVPFASLSPDAIIEAVEAAGFRCDGRVLALGSYENRVYQVGLEDEAPLVAKFYRPGRWTDEAILEEHTFAAELAAAEIPVVAPMRAAPDAPSLLFHEGFRYALYPRQGGHWPELGKPEDRELVGRFLGRIHLVGSTTAFRHRPRLSSDMLGHDAVGYLLESGLIPDYIAHRYEAVSAELLEEIDVRFEAAGARRQIRIHGDCHRNNLLWTDNGPHFVDLDDCMTGPAIQDLWMLLAGGAAEMAAQLAEILEGYEQFMPFDRVEARLIESLRALRMLHYAAWLARRWHDPAFPRAFPWFGEVRYWERHVAELEEQLMVVGQT